MWLTLGLSRKYRADSNPGPWAGIYFFFFFLFSLHTYVILFISSIRTEIYVEPIPQRDCDLTLVPAGTLPLPGIRVCMIGVSTSVLDPPFPS